METKVYNSKLRALLSIRNFNSAFEKYYEQLKNIEEEFDRLNTNALSIIETNCKKHDVEKWKLSQEDVSDSIKSINEVLILLQKKIFKQSYFRKKISGRIRSPPKPLH